MEDPTASNSATRRTRRSVLRLLGTAATAGLAGCGSAATRDETDIDVVRDGNETDAPTATEAAGRDTATGTGARVEHLDAGEQRTVRLDGGDTLEDCVFDITADDADVQVVARGDDWAIRNVGFRGSTDVGVHDGGYLNLIDARGDGVIDSVYLGDGVSTDGIRKGGIGVNFRHAGHIDVRNCFAANWTDNAVYAAGMAEAKRHGGGGTLAIRNCYLRDNNIAHLRVASDGTVVENCVIHNTNHVPTHPVNGGVVSSRGIYTGYGEPQDVVTVRNTHVDVTSANTNGRAAAVESGRLDVWGTLSTVRVVDSEVRGRIVGGQVETVDVGNHPTTAVPEGVPTAP